MANSLEEPLQGSSTPQLFRPRRSSSPSRQPIITCRVLTNSRDVLATPPRRLKSESLEVPDLILAPSQENADLDSAKESSEAAEEMSSCETIFNLANTMVGSGVLAVPYAFRLTSYWAVALLLLVVAFTAFTACLIGESLQLARFRHGTWTSQHRDFTFLAEVSCGLRGKYLVAVATALELWVAVVTFLVMSGSNVQGLLGVDELHAVLVCTLLSTVMIFIPLRVYAYVSLASLIALLIASVAFVADLMMTPSWSFPEPKNPEIGDVFRAYGLFIFCFAGHPCFPALHEGMREVKHWTNCVALSFCIAALYYVALGLAAFIVLGTELHPVFTKDMRRGVLGQMTVAFFAVKIQLTTPVLLRVVLVSMQIWPEGMATRKEFLQSFLPAAVVIFLTGASACFLAQKVAALASFAGALLVNLTSVVTPAMMYMRLASSKTDQVKRLFCAFLVVFGLITAVAGTYLAVVDMG